MTKNDSKDKLRIAMFLAIVFGFYYIFWLVASILPEHAEKVAFAVLQFPLVFMGTPVMAAFITKMATKDKTKPGFRLNVLKNKKHFSFLL